jgi:dCMP deaminase
MREIQAIGYNGIPAGLPNEMCCEHMPGACGCVHAEANAIAKLSSKEPDLWLHCTHSPCPSCAGLIINRRNISTVTYETPFRDPAGINLLMRAGIHVDLFESGTNR